MNYIHSENSSLLRLIPCTKHVQDDIKRKLSSIGITADLKHDIMCDIFGNDKALEG